MILSLLWCFHTVFYITFHNLILQLHFEKDGRSNIFQNFILLSELDFEMKSSTLIISGCVKMLSERGVFLLHFYPITHYMSIWTHCICQYLYTYI